ncbi:SOS response-associated peptidase [Streptomyces sp. NBC_01197]|uniref:SOS response-associated peptidase n=1 Tax=Streptomyces sp. NBC_01197 TaxID=2903768 RepID=UPI002E0EDBFD|nr:SOS response-associated peptidase [Streptomyces sp. NBC_01197]
MCGRFAASRGPEDLAGVFGVEKGDAPWQSETVGPDWNVAPTKTVQAVLERPLKDAASRCPVRQLRNLRWGLVPSWAKSPEGAARMINARAETVQEKPSFRRAFAARRCLVPADGYYEWMTEPDERQLEVEGRKKRARKQPYFVTPADGSVMAFAGLYEFWRDPSLPGDDPQAWWATCTILTTEAETTPLALAGPGQGHGQPAGDEAGPAAPRSLAAIHPRMPLVLPPDRWDDWLDPAHTDPARLTPLLEPPPAGLVRAYPVSTAVSNVRNNGPELLTALEAPEEGTLF